MSEFEINEIVSPENEHERELLNKVSVGVPSDLKVRIPDAPDIDDKVALRMLGRDEIPVVGVHCVQWGSKLLSDIKVRPVSRTAHLTEDTYVALQVAQVKLLLDGGLKDPVYQDEDRLARTARNSRWRYRGFVCGQVDAL